MGKKSDKSSELEVPKIIESPKEVSGNLKTSQDSLPDTMKIASEREIAMDFAEKVYRTFNELVKSVVLFGSSAKNSAHAESDVDVIIITDDASVKWDLELIAWYREELGKIVKQNPYIKPLHVNTVKLSTWWEDLMRADPVVINVIRYGEPLIDFGGFFSPLKILLQEGKIKPTAESVYTLLQRAPQHIQRARAAELSIIDSLYWACVDSAHAALIAIKIMPPSPEHITNIMKKEMVDKGLLKEKYVDYYQGIFSLAKDVVHGKVKSVSGKDIDSWFEKADEFIYQMAKFIDNLKD